MSIVQTPSENEQVVCIIDAGGVSQTYTKERVEQGFIGAGYGGKVHIHYFQLGAIAKLHGLGPVLLLGEKAVRNYTGTTKLIKTRGSWTKVFPNIGGNAAMICMEPAWFNRGMTHKYPLFQWDIQKFLRGPVPIPEEFYLNPSGEILTSCIERLLTLPIWTIDTEWYSPHDMAYVGFGDGKGFAFTLKVDDTNEEIIRNLLRTDIPKIFQNAMFDCVFMDMHGYPVNGEIHDTMVAFHNAYPDLREKGLGTLSSVYTPRSYYKDEVEFVGSDDEAGQTYCCRDVDATGESYPKIISDLTTTGTKPGYDISMSVFECFRRATVKGIRIDRDRFDTRRAEYLSEAERIETALRAAIGIPDFNCRSSQQVQKLVFDTLKLKGRSRTSEQSVLMDIAADPRTSDTIRSVLTAIIRVRQNRKLVSSYFNDNIFGLDDRVRTNWNLAGTRSGRLASSKLWGQGLALQTIPVKARTIFVPDPGYCFVGFDLAQAEARVVAVLTRDFDLLDAMDSGIDIHCLLGSQIPQFGLTYEEMMEKKDAEGGDYRERYLSKKLRHSINYVASPNSVKASINRDYLDTGIGVSLAECKLLHGRTLEIHPGLPTWWRRTKSLMYTNMGELVNPFGRRRNFAHAGRITDHLHREGVSFLPQSTIGDLTTQIIRRVDDAFDNGHRGQVLTHMHDGMMAQVLLEDREWATDVMMEAADITFVVDGYELKIPVDVKWSDDSWAKC